ncbi:unnamed protein product [Cochlearia groenlandica]
MTTVSSASAAVTETGAKVTGRNGKLRVMCRYGGDIVSLPQSKSMRYVGGDIRIVAVPSSAETSFASLIGHLKVTLGISYPFKVKYQLPDQELDSLISVETDDDVEIMMEEHGYLSSDSSIPKSRIRLFLFPSKSRDNEADSSQGDLTQCKAVTDIDWLGIYESKPELIRQSNTDLWFVDALKSVEMLQTSGSGGICGQESMMLETNSSFGSTSSSASSSNVPPIKSTSGEDSQVKFAPIESVTRYDNTSLAPISSHELPTSPQIVENKLPSNSYEAKLNKPVPIQFYGYQPVLNQAQQQQHIQVIYTGNSPTTFPATPYHHTNHIQYQYLPQPYPVCYIPLEQYSSRHVPSQAPHVNPGTVLQTHQSVSPVVRTNSPLLAPELASQVSLPDKPDDETVQTSSEAYIYNTDIDDDAARARIYKSQPPTPVPLIPSQYQTMMQN